MIWYYHENERESREKIKKIKKMLDFYLGGGEGDKQVN